MIIQILLTIVGASWFIVNGCFTSSARIKVCDKSNAGTSVWVKLMSFDANQYYKWNAGTLSNRGGDYINADSCCDSSQMDDDDVCVGITDTDVCAWVQTGWNPTWTLQITGSDALCIEAIYVQGETYTTFCDDDQSLTNCKTWGGGAGFCEGAGHTTLMEYQRLWIKKNSANYCAKIKFYVDSSTSDQEAIVCDRLDCGSNCE